jgi:trimeric autotransporter adhesin
MAQITLNSTGVASNGSLVLQSNGTTAAVTIDTSQRAAFVAGTEALPAITTTGDTNTGMWFPAADTIAFSEGGAEAMRIDSDGDVGIGTSSPSDKLTVISAGTQVGSTNFRNIARIGLATNDASVLLGYDVSAGSAILASTNNYPIAFWTSIAGTYAEKMRIDSSGNVGIGTSSPTMKLDISTSYGGLYIKSTSKWDVIREYKFCNKMADTC